MMLQSINECKQEVNGKGDDTWMDERKWIDRQTDRQTDSHTDKKVDIQTYTHVIDR